MRRGQAGQVDVIVRLSMKTHRVGWFLFESSISLHGKPGYPFIVTIDGQSVVWREDGQMERTPEFKEEGGRTPEGGEGRRYVLQKRFRLAPGVHRFEIDLPEESYAYALELTLEERKEPYLLELKPVYWWVRHLGRHFTHGVVGLKPFLDGKAYEAVSSKSP
jgi:hypothetical protein